MQDSWVIWVAIAFTVAAKVFQYTTEYHGSLLNKWNPHIKLLREKVREQVVLTETNNSLSAQDNYAKWTKNNRKLDKLKKEIDDLSEQVKKYNSQSQSLISKLKLVVLTVPFFIFKIWKGKHVVYYLPSRDTFPSLISGVWNQGFMFIPMAPLNWWRYGQFNTSSSLNVGVSLAIWCWALNSVISNVEFIVDKLFLQPKLVKPEIKTN